MKGRISEGRNCVKEKRKEGDSERRGREGSEGEGRDGKNVREGR